MLVGDSSRTTIKPQELRLFGRCLVAHTHTHQNIARATAFIEFVSGKKLYHLYSRQVVTVTLLVERSLDEMEGASGSQERNSMLT